MIIAHKSTIVLQQRWVAREANAREAKRAQETSRQLEESNTQLLEAQFPLSFTTEQRRLAYNNFAKGMHDACNK